ncbi:MAG: HD domain-containing protein [Lawsonibacter sp.]
MNHYLEEFCRTTEELLGSDAVRMMGRWKHHGHISTLDHSLFVAYCSYRAARALRLDETAAARAGLLHDLYLYDSRDTSAHPGWQCFDHPRAAARNAAELTALSEKERNIILSHMWPLGGQLPRSWEAWLVDLVDTLCAGLELAHIYHPGRLRERLGGPAPPGGGAGCCPLLTAGRPPSRVIPGAAAALRFEVSCPKTRES